MNERQEREDMPERNGGTWQPLLAGNQPLLHSRMLLPHCHLLFLGGHERRVIKRERQARARALSLLS